MMNAAFMKKLSEIEKRTKSISDDAPGLIMISFNDILNKWICKPLYHDGKYHNGTFRFCAEVERLQDYFLPEDFHGSVILETFGSPEKQYTENMFSFNADEIREGKEGAFCITSICESGKKESEIHIQFKVGKEGAFNGRPKQHEKGI